MELPNPEEIQIWEGENESPRSRSHLLLQLLLDIAAFICKHSGCCGNGLIDVAEKPKILKRFDNVHRVLSKTASLLLRRSVFRMVWHRGERKTRVTEDETQGTMGRVKKGGEARLAPLLFPAFLCAQIFIERETSGYEVNR